MNLSLKMLAIALCLTLTACGGDDDAGSPATDAATGRQDLDGATADGGADTANESTLIADGEYFTGFKLSLAGAQLRMKVDITVTGEAGKGGSFKTFDVYGLGAASDWVSPEPIGSLKDVPIAADGTFTADMGKFVVPAKSSPTGTPVESNLVIKGTVDSENNTMCGALEGAIPAFEADLKGSTFKAVPWGTEKDPYEVSCETEVKQYKPIDKCPTLKAGQNKMVSAEFDRGFTVSLPAAATTTKDKLPMLFVYHGNTGNATGILQSMGWLKIQAAETESPFIIVAPETTTEVNGSKPVLDWRYGEKAFDMDNRELVFFDDLRKCVAEQFNGDSDRLYVSGMSAGGMMSSFLSAHRGGDIAASAPFSGGYLHEWPSDATKSPMMFSWGGPTDTAYQQNFHTLALNMFEALDANGWWYAQCNHNTGHKSPSALVALAWEFLKAHRLGEGPKFKDGLPADFPDYCKVP